MAEQELRAYAETSERLRRWAQVSGLADAETLVVDLADLRRAASEYIVLVDRLSTSDPTTPEQAKCLTEIQVWLYDELAHHLESLRAPLQNVAARAYESAGLDT